MTNGQMKKASPLRSLAKEIAAKLFTVGACGKKADHLQHWRDGDYCGGWGEKPMADTILTLLDQAGVTISAKSEQSGKTPARILQAINDMPPRMRRRFVDDYNAFEPTIPAKPAKRTRRKVK